jgi:hypothetical protein
MSAVKNHSTVDHLLWPTRDNIIFRRYELAVRHENTLIKALENIQSLPRQGCAKIIDGITKAHAEAEYLRTVLAEDLKILGFRTELKPSAVLPAVACKKVDEIPLPEPVDLSRAISIGKRLLSKESPSTAKKTVNPQRQNLKVVKKLSRGCKGFGHPAFMNGGAD